MSYLNPKELVVGQLIALSCEHSCEYSMYKVSKVTKTKVTLVCQNDTDITISYSLISGKRVGVNWVEYHYGRIWSIEEAMMRREQEQNAIKVRILWKQLSEAVERRNIDAATEFVNAINTANFLSLNKMEYMTK